MRSEAFREILLRLDRGESPELVLSANGKDYIRRFVAGDRLILLGGGHVSLDVYRMALMLDFSITVVDDRPSFANHGRFPEAEVICDSFVSAIEKLEITERDYVCVLTRGHQWDRQCVEAILSGKMPYYLGMISSRRRAEGLKALLAEQGYEQARIDTLRAPIGLPVGAMTTAEIALSICAEMISERRKTKYIPRDNELLQTNVDLGMLSYLASSEEPRAVLTVLSSSGSTPVKGGSMMAVNRLGATRGTIGGGCSEAAALVNARKLIGTGQSKVMTFDMSDEVAAENGMVCGGEMTVLIEDVL